MGLPNFIGIGAERSGTTWVYRVLREHPEIFVPYIKEVRYFDLNFDEDLAWYETWFDAENEKVIGEISPQYLHDPHVPARMGNALPNAKLIVVLRDPIDRAYSEYWRHMHKQIENLSSVSPYDFAAKLEEDPVYVQKGLYAEQLGRFLEIFPRKNFHIILYDDIVCAPHEVVRDLYAFLGVRAGFTPSVLTRRVNEAKSMKNLRLFRLLRRLVRLMEKMGLGSVVRWIKQRGGQDAVLRRLRSSYEYPPLPNDIRARLQSIFASDIDRLEKLTGYDLSLWKPDRANDDNQHSPIGLSD